MTNKVSKYEQQADKLVKAIDIAEQVIKESIDFVDELRKPMLTFGTVTKQNAKYPEPKFRNLTSLKYLETAFFTFWNESEGVDVDKFWDKVYQSKLGYVRKDEIHDVLKRKKIKNIHEFDFITDNIVVYQQAGRLSQEQVIELNKYIGDFEQKSKRK